MKTSNLVKTLACIMLTLMAWLAFGMMAGFFAVAQLIPALLLAIPVYAMAVFSALGGLVATATAAAVWFVEEI